MSIHEKQLAGCEGKVALNREQAKTAAKRQRKKGRKVEAYKCSFCAKWHVGGINPAEAIPSEPRKIRPTPERAARGEWVAVGGKAAVERHIRDVAAHPIDDLEHRGVISKEQADAGRQFEQLWRAANQVPGIRDSTTIWEPKGHDEGDGDVDSVKRKREIEAFLRKEQVRQLIWVCVQHEKIGPHNHGVLCETLNEAARFFGYEKKKA